MCIINRRNERVIAFVTAALSWCLLVDEAYTVGVAQASAIEKNLSIADPRNRIGEPAAAALAVAVYKDFYTFRWKTFKITKCKLAE